MTHTNALHSTTSSLVTASHLLNPLSPRGLSPLGKTPFGQREQEVPPAQGTLPPPPFTEVDAGRWGGSGDVAQDAEEQRHPRGRGRGTSARGKGKPENQGRNPDTHVPGCAELDARTRRRLTEGGEGERGRRGHTRTTVGTAGSLTQCGE